MMRVAVVDDDPDITRFDSIILTNAGHTVVTLNGPQALAYPGWADVDVAVVDLLMPDVNGIELLHFLRREHPNVRRVVCSAITRLTPEVLVLTDAVVDKPFTPVDLLAAIRTEERVPPPPI